MRSQKIEAKTKAVHNGGWKREFAEIIHHTFKGCVEILFIFSSRVARVPGPCVRVCLNILHIYWRASPSGSILEKRFCRHADVFNGIPLNRTELGIMHGIQTLAIDIPSTRSTVFNVNSEHHHHHQLISGICYPHSR